MHSNGRMKAGFGLGALNDADEDDLDVYDGSLRTTAGRRVAYDFTDDDDSITMGSSHQSRRRASNVCQVHATQGYVADKHK